MEALGVERGMHQPSERVLKLIAQALNISAETLLIQADLRGSRISRRPALLLIQGLGLDRAGWARPSAPCSAGTGWCWSTTGAAAGASLLARSAWRTWPVTCWPCSTTPGSAPRTCWARASAA